ncbi:alpha/beta hydrolase [Nocardioides iriomotensis]|uniref:Alpha/beta fold hydrolase n=1 Tax=Nocardioides iriomotensis TaxID=715784 RepID=A0A4Q5IWN7_9ACTN|nr:alpha/beta hydrolase [Nocardioides iriomotensis]RYU09259.1 alpha/beta fold hydrolase [Nocardioides iriomotensis]
MPTATTRVLTPARIVALVILALLVAGLGYLRLSQDASTVTVPTGARAGDLSLRPCTYATEDGDRAADCGTLVVRENRADPPSRLIALPVIRVHARSARPAEPIFFLTGGPGGTNLDFPAASRFADDHDFVLVGYRGVDGSVSLDCPEVESALAASDDFLSTASFEGFADGYRACAARLTDEGIDLTRYGLVQQVDDLEAARIGLGYDRIDLLGESAGTRTAIIFGWRHPESVFRTVVLGVNPPGNYLWDPTASSEQMARFAALCAADRSCSARTDDLTAAVRRATTDVPDRWFLLPIKEGTVQTVWFFSLMQSTEQQGVTFDTLLSADEGDASGLWLQSLLGDLIFPGLHNWGQYAAAGSADSAASRDYFVSGQAPYSSPAYGGTSFAWGGGRLADAWPVAAGVDRYSRVRPSDVETLLVGGELDTSTPPQVATDQLLPSLSNGQEVVLPGFGHTASLFDDQPDAMARLVTSYLATGVADTSLFRPQTVDFTPSPTGTAQAKLLAGALLGLALLAVASLAWMARRVRTRGGFGGRASVALRSVAPVVLGLGGWSLALLLVLVTEVDLPLDGVVMTLAGVGIPVSAGVHLAWAHGTRAPADRAAGWAAALAGGLIGASLGAGALPGLPSVLVAVVGAGVGANLAMLVLDMTSEASARTGTGQRVRSRTDQSPLVKTVR